MSTPVIHDSAALFDGDLAKAPTPGEWRRQLIGLLLGVVGAGRVVAWQLADWALRVATIWFFLGAFGIEQTIGNALLAQAAMSLATLVPATPGGRRSEPVGSTSAPSGGPPAPAPATRGS